MSNQMQTGLLSRHELEELKRSLDSAAVACRLGLTGRYGRLYCPACQPEGGKTPDLALSEGGFRCFKCGERGDVISLVRLVQRCSFREAVGWLQADRPYFAIGQSKKRDVSTRPKVVPNPDVYEALIKACNRPAGRTLDYLIGRGISEKVIMRLNIRTSGQAFSEIWCSLRQRFSDQRLEECGLQRFHYSRWRYVFEPFVRKNATFLLVPYIVNGRVQFIKSRAIGSKKELEVAGIPRFINVRGKVPAPFNIDLAKDSRKLIICEGETDTMSALSWGYPAIGIAGWGHFKEEWTSQFADCSVFLAVDSDEGGNFARKDIAEKFVRNGLSCPKIVNLPNGTDVNSCGEELFSQVLETAGY